MTWSTNDGVASTINLSHSSGAETVFILKRLLKNEGWTVLSSSDGTTYNSSGDQITSSGSGAGGMDNNYAWFRIEDPVSLREYVFQRSSSNSYTWKWLYSASDGFTGGSPDATTIPTATDQQGLSQRSINFQSLFPTSGTWRVHVAADDAAHNGVYAWWCCVYSSGEKTLMLCDAIDSNTAYSADNDPCVHYGSDTTPIYTNLADNYISTDPDRFSCWLRYGETNEEWVGIAVAYMAAASFVYTPAPYQSGTVQDPHDSDKYVVAQMNLVRTRSDGNLVGYKGAFKNIRWNPNTAVINYADLVQTGSDYWLVWQDIILFGWPDSTAPLT